jgi:hypothetical protein
MSEYSIVALVMLAVGLAVVACSIISLFKQKVFLDATGNPIMNEINIPFWGKVKTNTAAITLAALGAFIVWEAGRLETTSIEHGQPKLITFRGEVTLDGQAADLPSLTVGLTSGSWFYTATPNTGDLTIPVAITVPNSWPSYSAFAFAPGSGGVRPKIIGVNLENPTFSLRVGQ